MNIDDPWPTLDEAEARVLNIQTKLHQWAISDPDRRFDDLYNLVADPAHSLPWRGLGCGAIGGHGLLESTEWFPARSCSTRR